MTATLFLGTGPRDEPIPADEGEAFRACAAFRSAFRMLLGDEPGGACLRVVRDTDGDAHFHLVCEFDPNDAEAARYAAACGRTEIDTWAAGLTAPTRRGTRSGQGR